MNKLALKQHTISNVRVTTTFNRFPTFPKRKWNKLYWKRFSSLPVNFCKRRTAPQSCWAQKDRAFQDCLQFSSSCFNGRITTKQLFQFHRNSTCFRSCSLGPKLSHDRTARLCSSLSYSRSGYLPRLHILLKEKTMRATSLLCGSTLASTITIQLPILWQTGIRELSRLSSSLCGLGTVLELYTDSK